MPCNDEAMNAEAEAELRALRARAYGPDADILSDPAAYERLQQLEADARREQEPDVADGAPPAPALTPSPQTDPAGQAAPARLADEPPEIDSAADPGGTERAVSSPLTRTPPLARALWIVSIAAAATLAASVTWALASIPVISDQTGARQVAALEPDPSVEAPPFFGDPSQQSAGYRFAGFTVTRVLNSTYGPGGECLVIFTTDQRDQDPESFSGNLYSGCGTGTFPAIVAVPLAADAPAEALERFGEGTELQFILVGDRVGVYSDAELTPPLTRPRDHRARQPTP